MVLVFNESLARASFAVCITGQLRSGALIEVQENLATAVSRPLEADVFAVLSTEHSLAHIDFHIPAHGCNDDIVKCAPRDGDDISETELRELRKKPPLSYDTHWSRRKPARRPSATSSEINFFRQGPLRPMKVIIANDSEAISNATSRYGQANANLFQKALRARNRLCAELIDEQEQIRNKQYDYIVRIRPDYAFSTCRLPPAEVWPKKIDIPWATTHMDFFEIMTRSAADALLKDVWSLDPPLACLVGQRVESCGFYSLCRAGTNVTAADALSIHARDGRGTPFPGDLLRPCCHQDQIPRVLLQPPHHRWCPLHRISYLQGWWFQNAKRNSRRVTREVANSQLGPHCTKIDPDPSSYDDDDNAATDEDDHSDDDAIYITRPHEWWRDSYIHLLADDIKGEELRR